MKSGWTLRLTCIIDMSATLCHTATSLPYDCLPLQLAIPWGNEHILGRYPVQVYSSFNYCVSWCFFFDKNMSKFCEDLIPWFPKFLKPSVGSGSFPFVGPHLQIAASSRVVVNKMFSVQCQKQWESLFVGKSQPHRATPRDKFVYNLYMTLYITKASWEAGYLWFANKVRIGGVGGGSCLKLPKTS